MSYENLIASVEVNAEEISKDMVEKANREAGEIRRDAHVKAERIRKMHRENASKAAESERNKLVSSANEEAKMRIMKAKDAIFQKAFVEAERNLSSVRSLPQYGDTFKEMVREAMRELEGETVVLHIDPRDEQLCRKTVQELQIQGDIVTDLDSAGGLVASTADGRYIILNTIESRLERAREILKPEIFSILYGG
jgi:V/A-type H+/Na+-transporting ATPase subunit E